MFTAVLGLFSQDLAIDLGSSYTRVVLRGSGLVSEAPTVVSIHTARTGARSVCAIGEEALPMIGRTPEDIEAIHPVRESQIVNYEVAEAFLLHLVRQLHGRNSMIRPRMIIPIPHNASEMALRAVRDSCEFSGARSVELVSRPIAGALGAGLPIDEPTGSMVVDIGGGSTEVSVISMSDVVFSLTVPGGGTGMDEAIIHYLQRHHALLVGPRTAESLKIRLGAACPTPNERREVVKGRCLRQGVPKAVSISGADIQLALEERITEIANAVRSVLERVSSELANDIVDNGVVLIGGGAQLPQIDAALRHHTGLPMVAAQDPATAVIRGAGQLYERPQARSKAVAC